MKYQSTRSGRSHGDIFTFEDCILKGYAPDGGLFLPEHFPEISLATLKSWVELSYQEIVFEVAKLYIDADEILTNDLKEVINGAFRQFSLSEIIRIVDVPSPPISSSQPYESIELQVAELFHGPTMAFKDLSIAFCGACLTYFLEKRNKRATIIVATSGDTGGSAVQALKGKNCVDVIVLFPAKVCTEMQKLHMITGPNNIHCFEVEGTSDDEDKVMATIFGDKAFVARHNLTNINSINWGRLLNQVANYFYIYLRSGIVLGETLSVIVPTGAGGNVTGGCIAREMGLPIAVTVATNSNDILHQFLQEGILKCPEQVYRTFASAMDIQVPYNLERLLNIYGQKVTDVDILSVIEAHFVDRHEVKSPEGVMSKLREVIRHSYCADDKKILEAMRRCWKETGYASCPHSATALACFYNSGLRASRSKTVCVATGSPHKFPEVLRKAGIPLQDGPIVKELRRLSVRPFDSMLKGQDWVEQLRNKIEAITALRESKTKQ